MQPFLCRHLQNVPPWKTLTLYRECTRLHPSTVYRCSRGPQSVSRPSTFDNFRDQDEPGLYIRGRSGTSAWATPYPQQKVRTAPQSLVSKHASWCMLGLTKNIVLWFDKTLDVHIILINRPHLRKTELFAYPEHAFTGYHFDMILAHVHIRTWQLPPRRYHDPYRIVDRARGGGGFTDVFGRWRDEVSGLENFMSVCISCV